MKKYSHNYGDYELQADRPTIVSNIEEELSEAAKYGEKEFKEKVKEIFSEWDHNKSLTDRLNLRYDYRKNNIQVETQFGNVARYYTDIIKLEAAFQEGIIDYGILILPTKERAEIIGSNIAYYKRAVKELKELRDIISCPIVVYGI